MLPPHHSPLTAADKIPRPRIGLQEDFEVRWNKMETRLRRANGGRSHPTMNAMRNEVSLDRMEDAIASLAPVVAASDPRISPIYGEHANLCGRYRVAFHSLEKSQRSLRHTIDDPVHAILQDVPRNWNLKWQHIDTSAEKDRTFSTVLEGRAACAELNRVVLALETMARMVDAAATVTSDNPAEVNRRMILKLHERIAAIAQQLSETPQPAKRSHHGKEEIARRAHARVGGAKLRPVDGAPSVKSRPAGRKRKSRARVKTATRRKARPRLAKLRHARQAPHAGQDAGA